MGGSGEGTFATQLHEVDDMTRFRRFLCFGSQLGRCATEDKKLTVENTACIMR